MIDILLDKNTHDFLLDENGDIQFVSGEDELEQRIKARLLTYYGEWFRDTSKGVKWREEAFVKGSNKNTVENMIKATIIEDPRVVEFLKFEFDINNLDRSGALKFTVLTIEDNKITIEI